MTDTGRDMASTGSILGLDVGGRRVGVAVASLTARLPRPLVTLTHDETFLECLERCIAEEDVIALVVGYPRNLAGDSTSQTKIIEDFTSQLKQQLSLPVYFQDEALTSKKAEAELKARGTPYDKTDIDALAATYILEDFLSEHEDFA